MNDTIRTQIETLNDMRLPELQARYAEVLGEETRAPNRTYLIRKITAALEARAADAPEAEAAQTQPEAPPPDEATEETADTPAPPDTATDDEAVEPAPPTETDNSDGEETKLTKLSVPELQVLYLEAVGRSTGSSHKRYVEPADMWSCADPAT
jgi:hypothetical protein